MPLEFKIDAKCGNARAGKVTLPRGEFETPVFMPVGTQATVKALAPDDITNIGYNLILSNAYHLYIRPGHELVEKFGGVHGFMAWPGLVLTDSGGYQVFSLNNLMKLSDDGVKFRSHVDGSAHFMTPEDNMRVQRAIGADMVMALDECPPSDAPIKRVKKAVERTISWLGRCRTVELKSHQTLIPIVQGGVDADLRRECASRMAEMDFPAYAIGGLSVGETKEEMMTSLEATVPHLPEKAPRYLMGVGMPEDLFNAVERGVDMFDCVLPTRMARNGSLFTSEGRLNFRNARFKDDPGPPDPECECWVCRNFSRAYMRHLFIAGEILAARLASFHNLSFYATITARMRQAIRDGRFAEEKNIFESKYSDGGTNGR